MSGHLDHSSDNENTKWLTVFELTFFAFVLVLRVASTPTANLSYVVLALYAVGGRANAIRALFVSWILTVFNPGIAAEATQGAVGRYLVIICAAVAVFFHSVYSSNYFLVRRETFYTLALGLFLVSHSLFISSIQDVSLLKSLSWGVATVTLISAWMGVSSAERARLSSQLFFGLSWLLVLSIPLLFLEVGFLRNGTGFQGIFNHPQVFGPTAALVGAWAAARMFSTSRPRWDCLLFVFLCLALVVLSESRTAGFAMVLGALGAIIVIPFMRNEKLESVAPGLLSPRFAAASLIGVAVLAVAGPFFSERIESYLLKRGQSASLAAAYEESRGGLISKMWENIERSPFEGIGFGVASDPGNMEIHRDPVLGLPTGAAVEKGVLPLAVLEEVGLFGFFAVLLWLWLFLRRSAEGGIISLSVFFTAVLLNMGEAALFSPGGFGLLLLIALGFSISEKA